jgi:hypothetical protein
MLISIWGLPYIKPTGFHNQNLRLRLLSLKQLVSYMLIVKYFDD